MKNNTIRINSCRSLFLFITTIGLMNACKKPFEPSPEPAGSVHSMNMRIALTASNLQVFTLAGDGSTAILNSPAGVAVDSHGNMYVADAANNRIRKITPDSIITTLAGSGTASFVNGNGTAATFNHPTGIAVDKNDNIYVADSLNNAIRKITQAGDVTTYAGTGQPGYTEGPASSAQFKGPAGVAVDTAGNVYVADAGNERIRKITTDRLVALLAGNDNAGYSDLPGRFAQFDTPTGITVDKNNIVYVADKGNNVIRSITQAGAVNTFAGSNGEFNGPVGVAVDSTGNVYVTDRNHQSINLVNTSGIVSTLAGDGMPAFKDGATASAEFNFPTGIALDAQGMVYVADAGNNRIRGIGIIKTVSTLAGGIQGFMNGVGTAAEFEGLGAIATDAAGNIYVADFGSCIRKITPAGVVTTLTGIIGNPGFAEGPGNVARFNSIQGLAVDAVGNIYAADEGNHRIRKVSPTGNVITIAGNGNRGSVNGPLGVGTLSYPAHVAVTPDGIVYVVDDNGVRKITPDGNMTTLANVGAWFLVLGHDGNLYTTRPGTGFNYVIIKITPAGVVSQVNNTGLVFQDDMTMDSAGNFYVTLGLLHKIIKITPSGTVSNFAGSGTAGFVDGRSNLARFNYPYGITMDANGNIYVTESNNHCVRKIQ